MGFNIIIIGKKISGLKMEISVLECISVRVNTPLRITQPQDFAPVHVRAQRTTFYHKLFVLNFLVESNSKVIRKMSF